MATDTLSGFKFYYGNKTMVLDDDWTFLYNNEDITNTISTVGSNLSGIVSSTSNFQSTLSGVKQNVFSMSGTYYTFDNSVRSSVVNLEQHIGTKLIDISSSLVTIQSQAVSNLSNNIQTSIQTLSGQIKTLRDQPPGPSAGFSYSSLTQTNDALVLNDGYNLNVTDGNLSLEESYTTPILKPSTNYATVTSYTLTNSIFHSSPSSASFSGTQVLTLVGHGADLTARAFWTIELFFYIPYYEQQKELFYVNSSAYLQVRTQGGTTGGNGKLAYFFGRGLNGTYDFQRQGTVTVNQGQWNHLAIQATNLSQMDFYLNGSLDISCTFTAGWSTINSVINSVNVGSNFKGYMDSIRMSCTPRYSGSSYTIPTAPYTVDPFTVYLNYFDTNPSFTSYLDTTPMNYSGIHLWLDANNSSTLTLSGSTLNTWADRSGNGRNATVNQTAPVFSSSGFNSSKPGLVFSTGNSLKCTSPVGSFNNGVTMFVVFSKTADGGSYETLITKTSGGSSASPWEFWGAGRHVGNAGVTGGAFINISNAGTNIRSARGANIFSAMLNTNSWSEYCNGSGVTATNFFYRMEDTVSLLHIGTRGDGVSSFTGCISEIIVYNRTLNLTERSEIETYLSNKWNVTIYNNKGQYCYTPTLTTINSGSLQLTKYKGLSNPTLQVNNSGVVIISTSDENLKKDIVTLSNSLEKINMITPIEFDWKEYPSHDYGFTAQDIRENLDHNMVYKVDEQEHWGFDTIKLIPFLTKAIQELDHQINELLER